MIGVVLINKYKKCTPCKKYKLRENFYNSSIYKDGLGYRCKKCDDAARAKWRQDSPLKAQQSARYRQIKFKYGLKKEEYIALLEKQNYTCKICKSIDPKTLNKISFCVDHCHKTGKIRGLLCSMCNRCLGLLKEDRQILQNMIKYLDKAETH